MREVDETILNTSISGRVVAVGETRVRSDQVAAVVLNFRIEDSHRHDGIQKSLSFINDYLMVIARLKSCSPPLVSQDFSKHPERHWILVGREFALHFKITNSL